MLKKTILGFFLIVRVLHGNITLSGHVYDSKSGEPIPFVNIYESNSNIGTVTDNSGFFVIKIADQKILKINFMHIAYKNNFQEFMSSDTSLKIFMTETLLQMNDVVVTSTRSGYLLRDVPIATEVIGKKEISESGAVTLSELLDQRAGVSTSVNVDGGAIFNMLGLDSRYILILKNGQPITGRFNNRVDLNQVSTNGIKKVEITKGPGSAVYGTDAMGGVINIITDEPGKKPKLNINYRASSFGSTISEISSEPLNSIASSNLVFPIKNITITNNITLQKFTKGQQFEYISADQIDKFNFNTGLRLDFTNHKVDISHQYFSQEDQGATRLSSGAVLYTNTTNIDRSQLTILHLWDIVKNTSIQQTLRNANYVREYGVIDIDGNTEKNDITIEDNTEYEILFKQNLNNIKINGGLEYSSPRYESDRITGGEQKRTITGVFSQLAWALSPSFDMVAGNRLDRYGDTTVVSPRIALAYKLNENWMIRTAYGHGFRAPSFMETLIDWEHIQFGYKVIGNTNLKPEISKGITIGAEYTNKNNFQLSALLYHNSFSNLIKDYALESGTLSYRNIERAYFTGLELITKWTITNYLSSSFTINYVKNEDEGGKQIPNTMPLSLGGRISYSPGNQRILYAINLKGIGEYFPEEFDPVSGDYISSSVSVKTYLMGDIQVIYKIDPKYQLVFGSKNIGNHINQSYGPYIGRTAYLEIQTQIER